MFPFCVIFLLSLGALAYEMKQRTSVGDGSFHASCIILTGLKAIAGLRQDERNERFQFLLMAYSREKRTLSRRQDSQLDDFPGFSSKKGQEARLGRTTSLSRSRSNFDVGGKLTRSFTTTTEALFQAFEEADDAVTRSISLGEIAEKGFQERWILEQDAVRVQEDTILGAGGFGVVLQGEFFGSAIALKLPKGSSEDVGEHAVKNHSLGNELRVLRIVWHPNIVKFYGCTIDPGSHEIMLVIELIEGVQLDSFVCTRAHPPSTAMRCRLMRHICLALRYLHEQIPCVVHGDLKGNNILVEFWDSGPRAKLLDFGLSRLLTKHVNPLGGTVRWMAPEVIRDRSGPPAASADVFSFGRLTYLIVTGRQPLKNMSCEDIVCAALQNRPLELKWPRTGPLLGEARPLSESCLSLTAMARPDMPDVMQALSSWKLPRESARRISINGSIVRIEPQLYSMSQPWREGLRSVRLQHLTMSPASRRLFSRMVTVIPNLRGDVEHSARTRDMMHSFMQEAKNVNRVVHTYRVSMATAEVRFATDSRFGSVIVPGELDGSQAALRVPVEQLCGVAPNRLSFVLLDLQALMHAKHPNITAFHGLCFDTVENLIVPVLEWVEGEPLQSFVRRLPENRNADMRMEGEPLQRFVRQLSEKPKAETRLSLLTDVCSALWYLHSKNPPLTHGALSGTGVIVEALISHPRAKIADVGFSRLLFQHSHCHRQSNALRRRKRLAWMAPEQVSRSSGWLAGGSEHYVTPEPSADICSFGRLCYLVVARSVPFEDVPLAVLERAALERTLVPFAWPESVDDLLFPLQSMAERCSTPEAPLRPQSCALYGELRRFKQKEWYPSFEGGDESPKAVSTKIGNMWNSVSELTDGPMDDAGNTVLDAADMVFINKAHRPRTQDGRLSNWRWSPRTLRHH
eukprot:TRINITY_DN23972_c0_g1_i2.p1 TRINITY_DN23972_c0_g1~~TRINITY_DN23972_c0_g1_i2.p1  ORF type:complete len:978 (+),score=147.14 TRINITY_DN23972_c0_g1_i2:196-2934(+)